MAELSSRSGTSVASIKYYLREGLLAAGTATGRNQAEYDEAHVKRLHLIRALLDVGGLSIAAVRDVLSAVDTPNLDVNSLMGSAHRHLDRSARTDRSDPRWQAARAEMLALVQRRGWYVADDSPSLDAAADAVTAMHVLDQSDLLALLDPYAQAAEAIAATEISVVARRREPARIVEGTVVGTIIGEALLNAIRRLAEQDASVRQLNPKS